ncbi:GlcG/HbpS family heme-binding protein [Chachezhania sediminis]|uniref:GlcG/HbpS family heme-binding protein n=1 Tax=Chachezhania sediminis TaxID=2599291 RepID=UPI00131A77AB|nr:heme-binding protein [Chachezhania sediminis]
MFSIETARVIVRAAQDEGRRKGFNPLAVIVLDEGGHTVAFEREDGASPGRYAVAHGKAYGAVMMGMAGTALTGLAEARPFFSAALTGVFDGHFAPVPGGVLIRNEDGLVIGAVGVSGDTSENDADAALAGIAAAGLTGER